MRRTLRRSSVFTLAFAMLSAAAGCPRPPGGDDVPTTTDASASDGPPEFSDAACGFVVTRHEAVPGIHVAEGSALTWPTNPPSSGNHFPIWALWGLATETIPRGYYVHNLEHGGVAVLYRCDGDCTAVRAQLEAVVRALPPEPACGGARRVLLTEDPLLDAPVAATAWGTTYRARCVDPTSLTAFVLARTGMAPEEVCFDGAYPPPRADGGVGDAASDAARD